jgi:hypothetical protein
MDIIIDVYWMHFLNGCALFPWDAYILAKEIVQQIICT